MNFIHNKADSNFYIVKQVLIFVFNEVKTGKKSLFALYILQIALGILGTFQRIYFQKLIIDKIALILQNSTEIAFEVKFSAIIILFTLTFDFVISVFQNIIGQKIEIIGETFNINWSEKLNRKSMRMPYEYTENPQILNKIQKAKEGRGPRARAQASEAREAAARAAGDRSCPRPVRTRAGVRSVQSGGDSSQGQHRAQACRHPPAGKRSHA